MANDPRPNPAAAFNGFEAIPIKITVRVGQATCRLAQLSELQPGQVIPLDRKIGESFELRSGDVLLGRVEPVAEHDGTALKLMDMRDDDRE